MPPKLAHDNMEWKQRTKKKIGKTIGARPTPTLKAMITENMAEFGCIFSFFSGDTTGGWLWCKKKKNILYPAPWQKNFCGGIFQYHWLMSSRELKVQFIDL